MGLLLVEGKWILFYKTVSILFESCSWCRVGLARNVREDFVRERAGRVGWICG